MPQTGTRTRLIGLPGTGKTTRLLELLDDLLKSYKPDDIIFASFSNAAVNEAIERVKNKFDIDRDDLPYFRTLHSLCLRLIKQKGVSLGTEPATPDDFGKFLWKFLQYEKEIREMIEDLTIKVGTTLYISDEEKDNPISLYTLSENPGLYFKSVLAYCVNNYGCTPLQSEQFAPHATEFLEMVDISDSYRSTYLTALIQVAIGWKKYKQQNGLFEFNELLGVVFQQKVVPDAKILIVDEFQDSSQLQAQLVELWSERMDQTIVAGDPNQAIYGFNGASPQYLEEFEYDHEIVLAKSWRVPEQVIAYSQQILDNKWTKQMHAGTDRQGRAYASDLASIPWDSYESIFVLARTSSVLEKVRKDLHKQGIFQGSKDPMIAVAYKIYWHYARSLPMDFADLLALWEIDQTRSKSLFDTEMDPIFAQARQYLPDREVSREMLEMILQITSPQTFLRDLRRWFTSRQWEEFQQLKHSNATPNASTDGSVELMTLHGSKGKEAELVVIITAASWYERERSIDEEEEQRLYFVAATRTKRDLVLVDYNGFAPTKFLPEPEERIEGSPSRNGSIQRLFNE